MDKVLLSICIPTYNRAKILEESLENLSNYICDSNIKVFVIDNASTDTTLQVAKKYSYVHYVRNEINIGADMNILKSYQIASQYSEYVCVLGDSYRFNSGVDKVLELLAKGDLNLLILGREYKTLSNKKSCYYNDINCLLADLGGLMDLVGSIVIKSEGVKDLHYLPYSWGNFIHFGMTFNYLSVLETPRCYFLSEVVLRSTQIDKTKQSWYQDSFKIFAKNWMLTVLSLPGKYSIKNKLLCIQRHDEYTGCFDYRRLIYLRINGCLHLKNVKTYINYIPFVTATPVLKILLIVITPQWVLKLMSKMYHLVK